VATPYANLIEKHRILWQARAAIIVLDGVGEFCKVRCVALCAPRQDVNANWPRAPGHSLFLSSGLAGSEVAALVSVLEHLDGAPA
jgi:hypothetical protein